MLLLFSLISISTGFVLARVTTFREYSAVMTDVTGTYQYVASMVPDPVTGIEQPIIVLNSSSYNYVGGIHSYVGGEALLSEQEQCLLFLSLVAVKTAVDFFGFFRVFLVGARSVVAPFVLLQTNELNRRSRRGCGPGA